MLYLLALNVVIGCCVLVQWGSVENRLAVGTTDDVYIVSKHVMSLHCCGAVS